ncbi:Endonuclease/exonuclease/phosphatase [Corchorus olitorius]|uniref:Endonuclease/exonuclease/phosphatase n=1 Tax=Corchorus olitorius TaxID=93759 RepID=A0A1R3K952_9ROSI|nr:Endonuclease/exonuclease/phosphatase [Corchorus olitorius]
MEITPPPGDSVDGKNNRTPAIKRSRTSEKNFMEEEPIAVEQNYPTLNKGGNLNFKEACTRGVINPSLSWEDVLGEEQELDINLTHEEAERKEWPVLPITKEVYQHETESSGIPQFGPWMVAQKRKGGGPRRKFTGNETSEKISTGSRFSALQGEQEESSAKSTNPSQANKATPTRGKQLDLPMNHTKSSKFSYNPHHSKAQGQAFKDITNISSSSKPNVVGPTQDPTPFSLDVEIPNPFSLSSSTTSPLLITPASTNPAFPNLTSDGMSFGEPHQSPTIPMDERGVEPGGGCPPTNSGTCIAEMQVEHDPTTPSGNGSECDFAMGFAAADSDGFVRAMRDLIKQHRPTIVAIMKTRINNSRAEEVLKKLGMPNWHIEEDHFFQAVTISVKVNNNERNLTSIYGSPSTGTREQLWSYLKDKSDQGDKPWEVISYCQLIDLGFVGPKFTWRRKGEGIITTWERIDRVVCNSNWKLQFPEATVFHLPRTRSDHCPLLLDTEGQVRPTPELKPFRFEAAWMSHENFAEFLEMRWEGNQGPMTEKLKQAVTEDEIKRAVFNIKSLKAPGPDGFQAVFFQKNWEILKDDIIGLVKTAFEKGNYQQKILIEKYLKQGSLNSNIGSGCKSHTWRSILKARKVLEKGLKWRVGDGSKISFWFDRWLLEEKTLAEHLCLTSNSHMNELRVSDFIDEHGCQIDKLFEYIPSCLIQKILSIHVILSSLSTNWQTKSYGDTLQMETFPLVQPIKAYLQMMLVLNIKLIWKLKVQPKIKTFIWLATNNRLLSNENRRVRNFTTDASCQTCGAEPESLLHILKDCPSAKAIWEIFMCFKKRNSALKMGKKPKIQWIKLNTYGSWDQKRCIAAAGGVFGDSNGTWLTGYGVNLGNCSIDMAEMWAIYYGVKYATRLNLNFLEIETDSKSSVQAIEAGVDTHHPLFPLVSEIKEMLNDSWWTLSYVPGEKNMMADWIVKWSCSQRPGVKSLNRPPAGSSNVLMADVMGIEYPRLIAI